MFARSIPVLCYHGTTEADHCPPERLEAHLDLIQDMGFTAITAQTLLDTALGRREPCGPEVVVTFDDGHLSNWLFAAPLLEQRSMPGVFFLVTDLAGEGPARTRESAPELKPSREGFMDFLERGDASQFVNAAEARALVERGHEVYGHSAAHARCFRNLSLRHHWAFHSHWGLAGIYGRPRDESLPEYAGGSAYVYDGFWPVFDPDGLRFVKRSPEERARFCREDFRRCMERMRELNGLDRQLFCWPWGQFDEVAESALRQAGFVGAFTLERGFNGEGADPFRLHRIAVGRSKNISWLRSRLKTYASGWKSRLAPKRYRKKPEISTVLFATNAHRLSGGSRQMVNNALGLAEAGLRVLVCTPPDSELRTALDHPDIEFADFERFQRSVATARFFRRLVRREDVDVVHTFHSRAQRGGVYARLAGRVFGPRFKLFINRGVIYKPNPLFGLFARVADGAVVNSFACREVLARWLVSRKRVNVVYNAFAGEPLPPTGPKDDGRPQALYVGNMAPVKGFDVFLRAVKRFGETRNPYSARFRALGIENLQRFKDQFPEEVLRMVESPGHVDHAEVMRSLGAADVYVLASRRESMPNTLLEAFAAGLPAVCTEAGGAAELIADGVNGHLCPVEDSACVAERMARLLEDGEERRRMGAVNRELIRTRLSNARKAMNLLRIYSGDHLAEPLDVEAVAAAIGAGREGE